MGRKGKNHQHSEPRPTKRRLGPYVLALALCTAIVIGGVLFVVSAGYQEVPTTLPRVRVEAQYVQKVSSLDDLLKMPPEHLAEIDIAEMNLLCATGLPGAEGLDVGKCLARLNAWAERVRFDTELHLHKFRENPGEYNGSEAFFRMMLLVTVLQQDCGVQRNADRVRSINFGDSKDLFIHGVIDGPTGGPCLSMPVVYAAVARRRGYPVRLVLTKGHMFCRWDAPGERFNVEATPRGMSSFDDDYYKTWPVKIPQAELKAGRFLVSLSAAEELACFLGSRGHCLQETGRAKDAVAAYASAHRLAPKDPAYAIWMRMAQSRLPGYHDPLEEAERVFASDQEARRRLGQPQNPGMPEPGLPNGLDPRGSHGPQPPSPYGPQPLSPFRTAPPSPYGPRPPSPFGPQPGAPREPMQPGQSAMPGQS